MSQYVVTDYKIKKDIEMYQKMGLNHEYATLVACYSNGVHERAYHIISEMREEQYEIANSIKDFIPLVDHMLASGLEAMKINSSPISNVSKTVETKESDN